MKFLLLTASLLVAASGAIQLRDRAPVVGDGVVGVWTVTTTDPRNPATLMVEEIDGSLRAHWYGPERIGRLADLEFDGDQLSFRFERSDARFRADVGDGQLRGELVSPAGTTAVSGERLGAVVSVRG